MKYIEKAQLVEWLNKEGVYRELLSEIEKGTFDVIEYAKMAQNFVGRELNNFYCNGFFGRVYDLKYAKILKVYEDHSEDEIVIEVEKQDGAIAYGYFAGGWNDWKSVYKYLGEWVG